MVMKNRTDAVVELNHKKNFPTVTILTNIYKSGQNLEK